LKGKDYRNLLEIIDLTYCAPCSEALFPPLYEKVARAIGCNSALYLAVTGAGLPKAKASGAVLFEMSQQLAREYADYYWTLDPFCTTGWIKKSNRATRVSDLVPYSSFANSDQRGGHPYLESEIGRGCSLADWPSTVQRKEDLSERPGRPRRGRADDPIESGNLPTGSS
jgi:hypothetical protein